MYYGLQAISKKLNPFKFKLPAVLPAAINQLSLRLISKEIRRAEHEYMNIHPPPPINALVSPLNLTVLNASI